MSKAEELLNSLVEAYVAESNPSSDSHIVIGVDRFITVPDELKRIAVQYDHNMRTVTFDCPRYYDGRDMSKMTVYINIRGPKGAPHSYIADNVRVDTSNPSVMHFDWTLRRPVTDAKGNLIFLVCIRKADSAGNEENHWNSELNTDLYISEGMEYTELEEFSYSDIVTQLLQRMGAVEALATPEAMQGYANDWLNENGNLVLEDIENKGNEVLNSIPDDYTTASNNADQALRVKADAITRTVDGEVISVADSSDNHVIGLRVFGKTTQFSTIGKNLINPRQEYTFPYDTLKYVINGDGGAHIIGSYEASGNEGWVCVTIGDIHLTGGVEYIISGGTSSYPIKLNSHEGADISGFCIEETICTVAEDTIVEVNICVHLNTEVDFVSYPMVRLASIEDPTWEPYTGGKPSPNPDYPQEIVSIENPTAKIIGANLVPFLKEGSIYNGQGLTLKVYADRCVCSGVPERVYASVANATITLPKGIYTVSGGKMEDGAMYLQVRVVRNGVASHYFGGDSFTIYGDETTISVTVQVGNTTAEVVNYTFYPILNVGNTMVDYEPYIVGPALVIPHVLSGIPVTHGGNYTDSDGQQWICDEVDFERGVYIKRIGVHNIHDYVSDGCIHSDNSMYSDTILRFDFGYQLGSRQQTPVLCNRFVNKFAHGDNVAILRATELISSHSVNDVISVFIDKTRLATPDLAGFEEWLNVNQTLVHVVLNKPIETPLSAEEFAAFRAIRSNYPNTTVINDSSVKMELKYNADTETYIDNVIRDTAFVVNIEISDHGYGTDKTSAEIYEAWSNNRRIVYKMNLLSGESEGIPLMFSAEVCMFMTYVTMSGMGNLVICTINGSTLTVEGMD